MYFSELIENIKATVGGTKAHRNQKNAAQPHLTTSSWLSFQALLPESTYLLCFIDLKE